MRLSYKLVGTILIALFSLNIGNAATFTAVTSGDWSAAATWGGTAPGNLIANGDQVIIPLGITVDLDMDVAVNDPASSIQVAGTLNSTTGNGLAIVNGSLSGAGTIDFGALALGSGGTLLFAGDLETGTLILNSNNLGLSLNTTVNDSLIIQNGDLSIQSTGVLTLANDVVIELEDGSFIDAGGTINQAGNVGIAYTGGSDSAGSELALTNITAVMVNLNSPTDQLVLTGDLTTSGILTLQSGTLDVGNQTLTLNGDLMTGADGYLSFDDMGNLTINTTGMLSSALAFSGGKETINDLTLNGGVTAQLASDLTVEGMLNLMDGTLDIQGSNLILNGDYTAGQNGNLAGNNQASLTVNSNGSLSSAIAFQNGAETLGGLTIDLAGSGQVQLDSDLTVDGILNLANGTLDIQGNNLTITGDYTAGASGNLATGDQANITISTSGSLTDAISFSGGADTLNDLTVNVGSGNQAQFGSDLTVDGMLNVMIGTLDIQDNSLTINGDYTAGAGGQLAVDNLADISINSNGSLSSAIAFDGSANTLNDLTINLGSAGEVQLGSDASVQGSLNLMNGTLNVQDNHLTLSGNYMAGLGGNLSFDDQGSLSINAAGSLTHGIALSGGTDTLNNLSIDIGSGGKAGINSDLHVQGMLDLANGTLDVQDQTLALYGNLQATAQGMLETNNQSNLWLMISGSASGALNFDASGNDLNNLIVNHTGSNIDLGSDVMVHGMLDLTSGNISVGSNDINVMSGATIQGGGPDSYVLADGSGTLMVNLSAGNSSTFPVGNASGYAGAELVLNSGSGTGNYSIRVMDNVYALGTTGADLSATEAVVDQTWLVETDAAGGVNLDLTLDWEAVAEVNGFDNQNAYISHYASAQWDSVASGSASSNANGTFSLTRSGITSLSPFAVFGGPSASTTFTAVASGDWSAAATWGGTSPGGLIDAGDDVVIPLGIDVNLDMDVVVNDANSSLSVAGTLSSNTTNSFTVANGSISGAGTVDIHRLNLESNASLLFAGSLSASTLMIEGQQLAIALITTVHDSLIVKNGSVLLQATGVINFDDGVVLSFDGGSLIDAGGSLSLSGDANIVYAGNTGSTGAELGLSSISSVTVDLNSASDEVELSGDLHVTDMLTIQTGTLNTGNNSLIIDGDFWASANGSLSMGDQADLTISSDASLTGAIWFKGGSDTLNNLTINIGNDGQAQFESDVHVMGELYLAAGTMAIHNQTLALYGDFQAFAQGHLATNSQTNLWLMTTGTVSGSLNLSDTANSVNNLVVDMSNDSIELGGDVLIHGALTLDNGNVANGDFDVMLSGSAAVQGGGLNSYIQTSGNGSVMAELNAGDNMMYHVGTAEAYAGAMIELNSGSSGGNYGVAVMNDVYAQGTAGSDLSIGQPLVDKTWLIDTDASGSVDVNLALTWEGASEVNAFDNQNAYISHYTGAQWDAVATASATANANGTYTITRNSVTSLSPFAVFDENTVVGIEDAEPLVELTIYPNPANEVLHVDQPNPQSLKAQVVGADGRVYYEFDLEAGTNAIDITKLENGHYFIRLEGNQGVYGFVKQ